MQRDVTASVFLGDRRVGVLGYHDGNTWFEYTDLSPDHPVLGQGFERDPRKRQHTPELSATQDADDHAGVLGSGLASTALV